MGRPLPPLPRSAEKNANKKKDKGKRQRKSHSLRPGPHLLPHHLILVGPQHYLLQFLPHLLLYGGILLRPWFPVGRWDRRGRFLIPEMQSDGWRSWMFPPTGFPETPLEFIYLGGPGLASHEEVMARLSLAATVPPMLGGSDRLCPLGQAWPYRCMAGEELEAPVGYLLPLRRSERWITVVLPA